MIFNLEIIIKKRGDQFFQVGKDTEKKKKKQHSLMETGELK
jgi:hypothetical protein